MVSRLLRGAADNQLDTPYTLYAPLEDGDEPSSLSETRPKAKGGAIIGLRGVTDQEKEAADSEHEQQRGAGDQVVPVGSRARSFSSGKSLKNRLKQVKAGFSSEKRGIADAFIESSKNKPQYMKEEHSNNLLV